MAGGFIGKLIEAIMNGPEGMPAASMSIAGLDPADPTFSNPPLLPERAFQFWPESIQDAIEIEWQSKPIPGGSHALMQWAQNTGRTISFEIRLHRFMKPVGDRQKPFEFILDPFELTGPGAEYLKDMRPHNVDIESEIRYLRAFCYPSYLQDSSGAVITYPPPIALLCVPGLGLNDDGNDVIMAVMTGCDVTYNLCFANGKPRNATVALTFKQIVQRGDAGVLWRGLKSGQQPFAFKAPDGAQSTDPATANTVGGMDVPAPGAGRKGKGINPGEAF